MPDVTREEKWSMVCPPVRRDNPRALANHAVSNFSMVPSIDLATYGISREKN